MNIRRKMLSGLLACFLGLAVSAGNTADVFAAAAQPSAVEFPCAACGIAADGEGGILITDSYNKQVWMLRDGKTVLYAGAKTKADSFGEPVGGYKDAETGKSTFRSPWAIAPYAGGWAVSDADNNVLRLIKGNQVTTIPCKGSGVAALSHPTGLAADNKGNLYVSDTFNGTVRKITKKGEVSTVAKGLKEPMGLCWNKGVLYIAETGANRIVKLKKGKLTTVAGTGKNGFKNAKAAKATFSGPQGVAVANGTIYVSDTGNGAVRTIRGGKVKTMLAADLSGMENSLLSPVGLLVQGDTLYVCDNFSQKVLTYALK